MEQKPTHLSSSYLSPVGASLTDNGSIAENTCGYVQKDHNIDDLAIFLMIFFTLVICLLGCVGNGIVIWLLGFRIKRTPINTYFLNLSIADFGVVTGVFAIDVYWLVAKLVYIQYRDPLKSIFRTLFLFMYSNSQFLLTVISVDRCVSVFLPLWYRCHRPPYLSTIVCAAIWILTFLLSPLHAILFLTIQYCYLWFYQFLLNALVFTSIMCASTITLFIKTCLISSQHKRGDLLTSILLALIFFLLFAFPMNAIQYLSLYIPHFDNPHLYEYAYICASLNSTVNPFIYFLVGRSKKTQPRSMKIILEKVFKEEEENQEAPDFSVQTQV